MNENNGTRIIGNKATVWLFALAVGFGWFSAFSGALVLSFAVSSAAFSCLLTLCDDLSKRGKVLALTSLLLLLPSFYFGLPFLATAVTIVLLSALIGFGYSNKMIKPDVVLFSTILLSLCFLAIGYSWIGDSCGSYAKQEVLSAVSETVNGWREEIVAYYNRPEFAEIISAYGADIISLLFDTVLGLSVSCLVVFAFFVCGITLKLFAFIRRRSVKDDEYLQYWRFTVPSSFAVFYLILFVLQLFSSGMQSTFSIAVMNLYFIFLVIFAYIGFRFLLFAISKRKTKKTLLYVLLFGSVLLFSSVAIEIISLNGVLAVIVANRLSDHYTDDM